MSRFFTLVILLGALALSAVAQEKTRIAVMNLKSKGAISEVVVPSINDFFCTSLPNYGSFEVIDGKTIAETGCRCGVYWHQHEDGSWFWQHKCFCGLGD